MIGRAPHAPTSGTGMVLEQAGFGWPRDGRMYPHKQSRGKAGKAPPQDNNTSRSSRLSSLSTALDPDKTDCTNSCF